MFSRDRLFGCGESTGDAGDQYTGLDRFGRVVDQRWIKTSDGTHTDRFKYGYDRNSNRLYRVNEVNAVFSELYHADGASAGYDNLDQLQEFQRGTLSDTNSDNVPDTVSTASRSQTWTLDAQGNWSSLNTDGSSVSRTHNKQNQVTAVGAASLTFDNNGNLTTDQNGQQYVFDAWNRLVTVKNSGGSTIASYKYDALARRVQQTVSSTTTDIYFTAAWQVLEERESLLVKAQYVWSPVYVDALVLRDRDADGNVLNGLEERLYVQQDANLNVTAIINTSGAVVERYIYDPYGSVSFLSSGWTGPADAYSWRYLHQGGKLESATGLYHFRNREFHPTLGRFIQVDPLNFGAGDSNLYRYVHNAPTTGVDPSGLSRIEARDLPDGRQELFYVHTNWASQAAFDWGSLGIGRLYRWTNGGDFSDPPVSIGIYDPLTGGVQRGNNFVGIERVRREAESSWGGRPNWDEFFQTNARDAMADRHHALVARDQATNLIGDPQRFIRQTENCPGQPDFTFENNSVESARQLRELGFEVALTAAPALGAVRLARLSSVRRLGAGRVVAAGSYPRDFLSRNTVNRTAQFRSEADARNFARNAIGRNPVDVGRNKLRSVDGRWQYRANPGDLAGNHVHLERLDPNTGEVLENWHLTFPSGNRR